MDIKHPQSIKDIANRVIVGAVDRQVVVWQFVVGRGSLNHVGGDFFHQRPHLQASESLGFCWNREAEILNGLNQFVH